MASRIRFRADEMLILRVALFRQIPGIGVLFATLAPAPRRRALQIERLRRRTVSAVRRALVSSSVYRQDVISRSRSRNTRRW